MDLLAQCELWHQAGDYQKIIDAIEALPADQRTPELDSELARACNNLAGPGDKELFRKAIRLLAPHEEYFQNDHCWNFRMGYAWYYLDEEGPALHYFEQALEARPGDEDTQQFIDDCRHRLTLPQFDRSFRQRVEEAWAAFGQAEEQLRALIDAPDRAKTQQELLDRCAAALELALDDPAFELGFNGQKHELVLCPNGDRTQLFVLAYFARRIPAPVAAHWNVQVGRQPSPGFTLQAAGREVRPETVRVKAKKTEHGAALTLYCPELSDLWKQDEDQVWWLLSLLTDQVLGELSAMALVDGFEVKNKPLGRGDFSLDGLPRRLAALGLEAPASADAWLQTSDLDYERQPDRDSDADWRMDVSRGVTRCPGLVAEYMQNRSDHMDRLHRQGAVAGFLLFPTDTFACEADPGQAAQDFRNELQAALEREAGPDAVTCIGWAEGLYAQYLDLIAWDLPAVLDAAMAFLQGSRVAWGAFHSFRRTVGTVRLADNTPAPVDPETGSLLTVADIQTLQDFEEKTSGYYGRMLQYLEEFVQSGVEEHRFTYRQAREDLQIALWYAFANNNLDTYLNYWQVTQWMPDSEKNAAGCGTWYYRYASALVYCGRLEEARRYAEEGARQEPDYPWVWLLLGRLRSHFGDRAGALAAADRGLELVPGDYEFRTLRQEIEAGATLEEMEYHWIDPASDAMLQEGRADEDDMFDKQQCLACIRLDAAGLERALAVFGPDPDRYEAGDPFCIFPYPVDGQEVPLVFRMNQAGLSKQDPARLAALKARLDAGGLCTARDDLGRPCTLDSVQVELGVRPTLLYRPDGTEDWYPLPLELD